MRRKFLLEIDDAGTGLKAFSGEEMEMFLRHGVDNFLGKKRMEEMNLRVFPYVDKPLNQNVLPLAKITLDHTEDKGFHLADEVVKKEIFRFRFENIPLERAYESQDDTLREQG